MPRRLDRAAAPWICTLVLLAFGLEAWAKTPPLTDAQRIKNLQRQILLREPAERRHELKERREQWKKAKKRKASAKGLRMRKPKPIRNDLTAAVQAARAAKLDFMAPSRAAALSAAAAPSNVLMNDTTGEPAGTTQSEISIAAHGNNVVAAWNDAIGIFDVPESHVMGFAYSTDGGQTWTDGGAPATSGNGVWASDPVVAVNEKTGAFYFSGLVDRSSSNSIDVCRGAFTGNSFTWATSVPIVTVPNSLALLDKEWMTCDSLTGNLYVSYSYFFGNSDEIRFQRSTNDGLNWSNPITLSSAGDAGLVQGSRPAVGPNGEVYVVWHAIGLSNSTLGVGPDHLRVRRSLDFGASFENETMAASVYSNFGSGGPGFNRGLGLTFPSIAVDRSEGIYRGRIYVSWAEAVNFVNDDYPNLGDPFVRESESNDGALLADTFTPGSMLRGVVSIPTDLDYWSWNATQGQTYMFWVDSLAIGLDASLRVFCTNATNPNVAPANLAFSQNGAGGEDFIVWTAPATATYFLRIASYQQGATGGYRIRSAAHNNSLGGRARDHRDAFVVSSNNNGLTWGIPVRANDSPAGFDDWLPEVAVDGVGRVYVSAYDWRDAVATCGGGSNAYLYRSDSGGLTWNAGTRISNYTTEWAEDYSLLIPNHGDYIGLYARDSAVFITWTDHRGNRGDPDCYFSRLGEICAGPPVTVQSVSTVGDSIVVTWQVESGTVAELYRREGNGAFVDLGPRTANAQNEITYSDTAVSTGVTYTYRLGIPGFCLPFGGEISATLPSPRGPELAILNIWPNPSQGDLNVSFVLDGTTRPATLTLHDVTGREVERLDVTGQGPYVVSLTPRAEIPPGIYFVRLAQGGVTRSRRVSIFP